MYYYHKLPLFIAAEDQVHIFQYYSLERQTLHPSLLLVLNATGFFHFFFFYPSQMAIKSFFFA